MSVSQNKFKFHNFFFINLNLINSFKLPIHTFVITTFLLFLYEYAVNIYFQALIIIFTQLKTER